MNEAGHYPFCVAAGADRTPFDVGIVLLLAACIVDVLARRLRRRRSSVRYADRRALGLCPACAYCLSGNVSGVCPECGTPAAR